MNAFYDFKLLNPFTEGGFSFSSTIKNYFNIDFFNNNSKINLILNLSNKTPILERMSFSRDIYETSIPERFLTNLKTLLGVEKIIIKEPLISIFYNINIENNKFYI